MSCHLLTSAVSSINDQIGQPGHVSIAPYGQSIAANFWIRDGLPIDGLGCLMNVV